MTCIVGLVHEDHVILGGDSLASGWNKVTVRRDPKVFYLDDMLFGFAGSYRMGQVLRWNLKKPRHLVKTDVETYMNTVFIEAVRKTLGEHGASHKKEEVEHNIGLFLVGYRGRLFRVDVDYQVGETLDGYDAIGSGEEFALGVMFATDETEPKVRVYEALAAAAKFTGTVRAPFLVETV